MGYMRHHAIVVSSFNKESIEEAHDTAVGLGMSVTGVSGSAVNGYRSFLVAPDGSKEGWSESDRGDEQRATFVEWLKGRAYDDGSTLLDWVHVQFGDQNLHTEIICDSDELRRR